MVDGTNLVPSLELTKHLERLSTIVHKPKGTILFRRGEAASGLYLIRRGEVSLTIDCNDPTLSPRIMTSGFFVGLPATVSGNPYSLSAEVVQDAELAFIPRKAVLGLLRQNSTLCFQVMEMLSEEISLIRSAFKSTDTHRRVRA
jgi:CRP/FNR family transcriptional regulator